MAREVFDFARLHAFDSTLRDGAQGEGISFSVQDKLGIARALDELGVDFIEAGNPGSNAKDLEFFRAAKGLRLRSAKLVAFGSTRRKDTAPGDDGNLRSLLLAETDYVAIFGKSWDFHVREILRATLEENLAMIKDTVEFLVSEGKTVIYDAEHFFDGYAENPEYAMASLRAAAEGGAAVLVLCDTNGGAPLGDFGRLTALVRESFGLPVGIHCHNDTGLAVAGSLLAAEAGATQVQGTLLGFGERTGNANLSSIVANLELKQGLPCLPEGRIASLTRICRTVAEIANIPLDDGMPFVGYHAFAHKAGMHIDAVTKNSRSCEHIPPESVGNQRTFLMSEVAGRTMILERLRRFDPSVGKDSPIAAKLVSIMKERELEGYQYEGADASFDLLVLKNLGRYRPFFELGYYKIIAEQAQSAGQSRAFAQIKIAVEGESHVTAAEGDGPVHALDGALREALGRFYPAVSRIRLTDYKVRVLDSRTGTAARVRVLIESTDGEDIWTTVGVSTDLIESSWIALVDSFVHKLIRDLERRLSRD